MSTATTTSSPQPEHRAAEDPGPSRGHRTRRWVLVLGGVVLVGGSVLGNVALVHAINDREPVLALTRDVPWGQRIGSEDIARVQLPPDARVAAVPETRRGEVIGQLATSALRAGSLLTDRDVSRQEIPGPGQRLVGLRVQPGRLPGQGLAANDPIAVTPVSDSTGTSTATGAAEPNSADAFRARVVRAGEPDAEGAVVVDVLIAESASPNAAVAASQGALLTLLGPDQ